MIEIFLAFSAGLISFLSPCVLPLIPGYISYISGSTLNELLEKKSINLFPIVLFTLGFSIVFISFGATATFLGSLVLDNSNTLRIVAGTIIIIFSLQIIGLINLKFLNYEKRFQADKKSGVFSSILVGMAFGFGWTPCIGPILGSILAIASTEESINKGILLLSFYSLGLALPFILSGYLIQKFMIFSKISSMPSPVFPEHGTALSVSIPITSSICFFVRSISEAGKSILFRTGIIS